VTYRALGRTGVQVSPICLGAMNFGGPTSEEDAVRIVDAAVDGGINFIDTANVYNAGESERIVGQALEQNGRRDQVVLATKAHGVMGPGPNDQGNSRYHLIRACEDSLRRLGTDHIDLYQIHRPSLEIPQDETLRALDDLVRSGKVRYIGCSTHPAWMVMEALMISERLGIARYISEQPPYNCSTVASRTNLFLWRENTVWRCCLGRRWPAESWRAVTTTQSPCPKAHAWNAAGAKARSDSVSLGAASRWPARSRRWRKSVVSRKASLGFSGARTSPASPRRSLVLAQWNSSTTPFMCSRCNSPIKTAPASMSSSAPGTPSATSTTRTTG
jgi:Aldo/keto reductase family